MTAALIAMGLAAGALTTVSGLGGGMLLVLILSVTHDPRFALSVTAPALLLGNLHRLWLYRRQVDWRLGLSLASGALPGSLLGGLLVAWLPEAVLHGTLLLLTLLAVAKDRGLIAWTPTARWMWPLGLVTGGISAVGSGAGLLLAPLLLAAGLRGERYIATGALVAVTMHLGRVAAYGTAGLVTTATLEVSAVLAVAILGGNLIGARARRSMSERTSTGLALGALCVCVGLALIGMIA